MTNVTYIFSGKPIKVPFVDTKYRRIKTSIPCPGTETILSKLAMYESRSMQGQMPIVWDHAENFNVFDKCGNKWIDFTSTIFVTNIGHANSRLTNALRELLNKPLLHTYAYANELRAEYIKRLVFFSQGHFEKAFLMSSGTEATEAALKLMRMYAYKKRKNRPGVICIEGNYHGRTLGAHMMSKRVTGDDWAGYQDPNIHHIRFPYPWKLNGNSGMAFLQAEMDALAKKAIDIKSDICGFMLETCQGWGAVFYPKDFVQGIGKICRDNDILLTFDEMQTGFVRTGKRFGYEHYEVKPDLICCGKGMGSGVSLSGVMGSAEIMDLPEVGEMSSTHSANPLVCAAGLATLEEIEAKNLISETQRKSVIFFEKLGNIQKKYSGCISNVLGKGLIAALIFRDSQGNCLSTLASRISERCMQKGVLVVHTGRESIKLAPPLIIEDEAIIEGVDVIDEAIGEALQEEA
jgi:4-aminobutyrate aminotransferase / (S)-3-amino-2-methylpropionate transaminase / 5-aminovalerate transaminase